MMRHLLSPASRGLIFALLATGACDTDERVGPSIAAELQTQPPAAVAAGIVFASYGMETETLNTVHTGSLRQPDPSSIVSLLSGARAKGARLILKLSGSRSTYQNADGTFNLTKWKAQVDRFRGVNLAPYLKDGTFLGHYMIDEPDLENEWGGKLVSPGVLEEMARHSKQIWPGLTTLVQARARWLASFPVTHTYLDAAWAHYSSQKGDVKQFIAKEVSSAKSKKLGLMVGMNILDGGNGSSGIRGTRSGHWAMSASELTTYGNALLGSPYSCGFAMWQYRAGYYGRADVKSAMAGLSSKARNHAATSCKQ